MDARIHDLKMSLVEMLNCYADIPIEVKRLLLGELYQEINALAVQEIQRQNAEILKQQEEIKGEE